MPKLLNIFTDISNKTNSLLQEIQHIDHPQAQLLRACLAEQRAALDHLLPQLSNADVELEQIKKWISIIYNSNDVASPVFRAWMRAMDWMELPDPAPEQQLEALVSGIKEQLTLAAGELEKRYGVEAVKYVVPSFYLPTLR